MGIVIGYCGTDIREINMWSVQKNHFRIMFISHTYIDNHGKKKIHQNLQSEWILSILTTHTKKIIV